MSWEFLRGEFMRILLKKVLTSNFPFYLFVDKNVCEKYTYRVRHVSPLAIPNAMWILERLIYEKGENEVKNHKIQLHVSKFENYYLRSHASFSRSSRTSHQEEQTNFETNRIEDDDQEEIRRPSSYQLRSDNPYCTSHPVDPIHHLQQYTDNNSNHLSICRTNKVHRKEKLAALRALSWKTHWGIVKWDRME